jgi:TRAP-type C4-dicarboxylate transport system substrate-binding protein
MKAEIYPASQLASIPRQIEGAQLGSIQIVLSAPEFLVGVDPRFELLAAPGMFHNDDQVIKAITDPEFANAFLAIGAARVFSVLAYWSMARWHSRCGRRLAPSQTSKARRSASLPRHSKPNRSPGLVEPACR